jgi:competence protein ComEC
MQQSLEPFANGLHGWRDVARDASHPPRIAQFRIDLRSVSSWLQTQLRPSFADRISSTAVGALKLIFRVAELMLLTVVLQVGMLPLLVRDFHRVTLSGALANLFAVPLTGILVPLGFATLALSLISAPAANLVATPLRLLTSFLVHGVDRVAQIPHSSYRIPSPPLWVVVLFFLFAVALAATLRIAPGQPSRPRRVFFVATLVMALLIATSPFPPRWHHGFLEFTTLDVGQGDSLLLVSPAGRTMLVDGGGSLADAAHRAENAVRIPTKTPSRRICGRAVSNGSMSLR